MLVSVDCRERGDRLNLSARRAAPWDAAEGTLIGFRPEDFQVEARRGGGRRRAPAASAPPAKAPPAAARNGNATSASPTPPAATTEAEAPGVRSPVGGEASQLVITIYETEDDVTDKALLSSVGALLRDHPGSGEVRLVIHDTDGLEQEFYLDRAAVSNELARSIEKVLAANKGTAVARHGRQLAGAVVGS